MKKVIILLLVVGLGIGAYFGYYDVQRWMINEDLESTLMANCTVQSTADLDEKWRKTQVCMVIEEDNKRFKQAAATSKTYKEFREKVNTIVNSFESPDPRLKKIDEEYQKRKQQHGKIN